MHKHQLHLIKIQAFADNNMHLKYVSTKYQTFCSGLNVLKGRLSILFYRLFQSVESSSLGGDSTGPRGQVFADVATYQVRGISVMFIHTHTHTHTHIYNTKCANCVAKKF